ncbi:coiled-coil protein [Nanoarchaeota archaeon]
MTENKAELEGRLKVLSDEVDAIKSELSQLNEKKEAAYQKKRDIGGEISKRIGTLTDSKKQRNKFTDSVKGLKNKRDVLNKQISDSIKEIKELKERHTKLSSSKNAQGNPVALFKKIEQMEFKMQTTPMEFSKEQALNKQIKDLKKQAGELKEVNDLWKAIREKSKTIDSLKREANQFHKEIQDMAGKSQAQHEEMLESSGEVDGLRKGEEDSYKEFLKLKSEYNEINENLKDKLAEMREIKQKLGQDTKEKKQKRREQETLTLKEREKVVKEKLKTGGKLTTEDLLVMQRLDDMELDMDDEPLMAENQPKEEKEEAKPVKKSAPKQTKAKAKKVPAKKTTKTAKKSTKETKAKPKAKKKASTKKVAKKSS